MLSSPFEGEVFRRSGTEGLLQNNTTTLALRPGRRATPPSKGGDTNN
jgi:hypothetical protein